jgi:hypothetical protein
MLAADAADQEDGSVRVQACVLACCKLGRVLGFLFGNGSAPDAGYRSRRADRLRRTLHRAVKAISCPPFVARFRKKEIYFQEQKILEKLSPICQ